MMMMMMMVSGRVLGPGLEFSLGWRRKFTEKQNLSPEHYYAYTLQLQSIYSIAAARN